MNVSPSGCCLSVSHLGWTSRHDELTIVTCPLNLLLQIQYYCNVNHKLNEKNVSEKMLGKLNGKMVK